MSFAQYQESCYECDGLNLDATYGDVVDGKQHMNVICRDCGAKWEDLEENDE